jgi:hypothetical protein
MRTDLVPSWPFQIPQLPDMAQGAHQLRLGFRDCAAATAKRGGDNSDARQSLITRTYQKTTVTTKGLSLENVEASSLITDCIIFN